ITNKTDFWSDMQNAQDILQKISSLKSCVSSYDKLNTQYEDLITLLEMAIEEDDNSVEDEIKNSYYAFLRSLESAKISTLLQGEYDKLNAILTFHAGAGGTEAQDWVEMLLRMYTRWGDKKGFKVKTLDYLAGDDAGIKSITILIEGINAYGFLKSESGVHRLVRISPFDSSGRRHTSFASLEVIPEIDDTIKVEIRPEDLKVDTFRAGGAGGQHINKTDSAVRITHIPTGIICACQNERSQYNNKDVAMKMLKSKLIEIKEREHLSKIEDIKGIHKDIAWGSQIRSYVFMPYTLVKDHRTNFENGNVNAVMDGDLDGFINSYLKAKSNGSI
ncbi:MAG: peptide chain release factor 2, partial [Oscillospiraceae bacterium]